VAVRVSWQGPHRHVLAKLQRTSADLLLVETGLVSGAPSAGATTGSRAYNRS